MASNGNDRYSANAGAPLPLLPKPPTLEPTPTTTQGGIVNPEAAAPLLIPDTEAAALAGVSRAHWQRLRAGGKLPPAVRLGRKVLWRRLEIQEWISAGCPDSRTWAAMQATAGRRLKVM
jgi:predicted DNA-binding transcriptional regulator AlpA